MRGKFIDLVRNRRLVLWVKYDYWYYFLVELEERGISRVLLVSGVFRPDQPFFPLVWAAAPVYAGEFYVILFVQTEASRELLRRLRLTENVKCQRRHAF